MISYTPQPGTVAARAVNALSLLAEGQELTTPVLLEAIGQPADWQGLTSCLGPAVEARLITKRMEGRKAFWGRGPACDALTLPAQPALEDHTAIDDLEPDSRPRVATAAETVLRKARNPRLPKAPTCTESQTAAPAPEPEAAASMEHDSDCEFAITSAGRLLIEAGDSRIALSKAQADQLIAYLRAQRVVEWERA